MVTTASAFTYNGISCVWGGATLSPSTAHLTLVWMIYVRLLSTRSDSTYWLIWMLSDTCSSSLDVHRKLQMRRKTLWRRAKFLLIQPHEFGSCRFLAVICCPKIFQIETRFDLPAFFFFLLCAYTKAYNGSLWNMPYFSMSASLYFFFPCKINRKSGKHPIFEY